MARFASAYERAATACAFSASGGQFDGTSDGTTALRYCSSPTRSITWTSLPVAETESLPRNGAPSTEIGSAAENVYGGCSADRAGKGERALEHHRTRSELRPVPRGIGDRPGNAGGQRHLLRRDQQDAHGCRLRRPERGARVVVGENAAVAPAVLRIAVGAPLAHPEAVAPAVTVEDEHRLRRTGRHVGRRRGGGRRRRGRAEAERGPRREHRDPETAEKRQRCGGQPKGGATHAVHGSRGPSGPRRGFTERFHGAENGEKGMTDHRRCKGTGRRSTGCAMTHAGAATVPTGRARRAGRRTARRSSGGTRRT